ncbi:MAG: polyphosphate polymerase domain-containing protein [Elusimicrobiaceae bacterium]|nr:polyphosphate polymerase domain-containing protein [Elusimicrobiaceae bacterium]MBT4402933.1 polyphosphate polymerase domain-containing protein [Elusimicrobiaceae bacterium]MBT4439869.1 polyphosphate polymerase domain-containing protein [Elusimicrobiaceae bacterium]MBT5987345.1 polyphosphate polymerase domain-containing protein [Elusimicrobiaceae bacterium]
MKNNNLKVYRSELKYLISKTEYRAFINRLKHVLPKDKHSQMGEGYLVRSLYFDSYNDSSLNEKQAGILFRKKYRMRIYDFDTNEVKFEIKHKLNNQIFKETATISRETAKKVMNEDYSDLLKYDNPILNKIHAKFVLGSYKPKIIVEYHRDAFNVGLFNIRITIDKYTKMNHHNFDLFSRNMHTTPVNFQDKHVLEIKFNRVLPDYVRKILQIDSFERVAFSKYVLSRRFLKKSSWEDN